MNSAFTLGSAFLFGIVASGHCLLMCGGIAGALSIATANSRSGGPRWSLLVAYQLGRVSSYTIAGLSVGALGAALIHFVDQEDVRVALRWLSAVVFALLGLNLLRKRNGLETALARTVWPRIAAHARRFFPVRRISQALAVGALWGWMPCGLAYSVLFVAWLEMDPLRSAAIMAMFGLGTIPAVLAGAVGANRLRVVLANAGLRSGLGALLLTFAALTAAGPWLAAHGMPASAMRWMPFDCAPR
ncbi:MAG: sulfite exporter TauE/SafE family protein [Rudaea sp.]